VVYLRSLALAQGTDPTVPASSAKLGIHASSGQVGLPDNMVSSGGHSSGQHSGTAAASSSPLTRLRSTLPSAPQQPRHHVPPVQPLRASPNSSIDPDLRLHTPRATAAPRRPLPEASCLQNRTVVISAGSHRTGTTSLWYYFTQGKPYVAAARSDYGVSYDQTYRSPTMEINFWNGKVQLSLQRYCTFYRPSSATRVLFEKTPNYALDRAVPFNVLAVLPVQQIRVVFTYREAEPHLWSVYVHGKASRSQNFSEYADYARRRAEGTESCLREEVQRGWLASLAAKDPFPQLVCRLSRLSRANYFAFGSRTRECFSSEFLWLAAVVHWSSLLPAWSLLAIPHLWIRDHNDAVRLALLRFSGLDGIVSTRQFLANPFQANSIYTGEEYAQLAAKITEHTAQIMRLGNLFDAMNGLPVKSVSQQLWTANESSNASSRHPLVDHVCARYESLPPSSPIPKPA
jgi:hypothetical protein